MGRIGSSLTQSEQILQPFEITGLAVTETPVGPFLVSCDPPRRRDAVMCGNQRQCFIYPPAGAVIMEALILYKCKR